ncbi:reverse transcriptase [Senna tora]|uniref:Reverse transcriptase n=1 Tax=Senna tora TaxID=362788 RepID=A0A834WRS8_9FABA|nr:reverse transcriptase [Senna tora]
MEALSLMKEVLKEWNRDTFGNVFHRKNILLKRLQGISLALSRNPNSYLVNLESRLDRELRKVLKYEEELWASKSRMNWLSLGDSNTKYFHSSVLGRRRQNRITCLRNVVGEWVSKPEEIIELIVNHFRCLYRSSSCNPLPDWVSFDIHLPELCPTFHVIPSPEEISAALFSLSPNKAAGLDGFQPAFIQKSWNTTRDLIINEIQSCFRLFRIPKEWNETMVCLVPKLPNPTEKSAVWFSSNTPDQQKSEISSSLNFKCVPSLGKYLGFPLGSSGRASDFKSIIDKISGRMDLWKSKYLSPYGKITLINSVINPIASYYMQCMYFPIGVCDSIDRLNRDFFWSDLNGNQKAHLVAWSKITKPKKLGGLGVHKCHERNLALLAKLFWRVSKDSHSNWAKVGRVALSMNVTRNTLIGKCLRKGREAAQSGLCKVINNGASTLFWEDRIGQIGYLRNLIYGPLNRNDNKLTVKDIVCDNGGWNWEALSFVLPSNICNRLQTLLVDPNSPVEDNVSWAGNLNGQFSTKSAYFLICSFKFSWPEDSNWSWIWKLGCHTRQKMFIWSVLMNGIPTKGNLAKRGMNISPLCPLCNQGIEECSHLFRDCPISQQMWDQATPFFALQNHSDFNLWIKINCSNLSPSIYNIPHGTLFIYLIWHLWNARNRKIFENVNFSATNIIFLARGKAGEYNFLVAKNAQCQKPPPISVKWTPPSPNWFKLNTDGSCILPSSDFGVGGILRVHMGNWIRGFSIFKGIGDSVLAELWAVYHGLLLASQSHVRKIIVEADSLLLAIPDMYPLLLADCMGIETQRRSGIG